ncbi:SDR family NAD(P)-dependent oxidoreductase [Nibricoccus sp. IMCC34717]|uniref:SDR family NAD(P)-dependent oxidoreductase n=1 Tax=Nibricoccus sp. IMCC34717 TaxID=3034021 RepID=UPI00384CF813
MNDLSFNFSGKSVLVTGGGRGIGFEIARQFCEAGAYIHLFERDAELLQAALRALPRSTGTLVDVADSERVGEAVRMCDEARPIDVLINNAGIAEEQGFLAITPESWRRILEVNLNGMFFVAQAVARRMTARRAGVILNMASKNGIDGESGYAHYNSSKGGVVMLTRTMAIELAHFGIRVNAVCPGYIQTPMSREIDPPEFVADFVQRYIPVGRPGVVEDVAPAFLFLASSGAAFINGQVLILDGGQLAGQNPSQELKRRLLGARD